MRLSRNVQNISRTKSSAELILEDDGAHATSCWHLEISWVASCQGPATLIYVKKKYIYIYIYTHVQNRSHIYMRLDKCIQFDEQHQNGASWLEKVTTSSHKQQIQWQQGKRRWDAFHSSSGKMRKNGSNLFESGSLSCLRMCWAWNTWSSAPNRSTLCPNSLKIDACSIG